MANLSDLIENFIKELLKESERDILEIQRNELANTFNCAPSQINYVLTTRFTLDKGYYIESKRGGGGFIKIKRVEIDKNDYIKESIWESFKEELSQLESEDYIEFLYERKFITRREAKIMLGVLNDKTLNIPRQVRDRLRANILRTMIISLID